MPRPPAEIHDRVRLRVDEVIYTAMRADPAGPGSDFARSAQQLVLAAAVSLSAALEAHRHVLGPQQIEVCRSCRTTDTCPTVRRIADTLAVYLPGPVILGRVEVWRRVDAVLNARERSLLIGIEEISFAYAAWAVSATYPGPHAKRDGVLLVDKYNGRITRWPALPISELSERYRRYINGEPFA